MIKFSERVESTQAGDMILMQGYSNVKSTYSLVVIISLLAIVLFKKSDLNWYASAEIYLCTLSVSISVAIFAFKMTG